MREIIDDLAAILPIFRQWTTKESAQFVSRCQSTHMSLANCIEVLPSVSRGALEDWH
jgi:hypothetical protein